MLLVFAMLVTFAVPVSANQLPFTDVPDDYVMFDAIKFVYDNGLMNGATETTFNPGGTLMRAMIVTILWRHAGAPTGYANPGFTDVETTDFFYDAVCWAAELGITTGTTATTFSPYRGLSLLETLMFLYRYAHHEDCCNMTYLLPEPEIMSSRIGVEGYTYSIPESFEDAVDWAANCGILPGGLTYFNGYQAATRAICANYLYKFMTLALGDGRVFSMTDLDIFGRKSLEPVCGYMNDMGYDANIQFDVHKVAMSFAFANTSIIYTQMHGLDNLIEFYDGTVMTVNDISTDELQNVDLIYLSACQAGGSFLRKLYNTGGVKAGVGFTEDVAITNYGDGGISYFDQRFFYYLDLRMFTLQGCRDKALDDMIKRYGSGSGLFLYGADSCVVYGVW